MAGIPPFSSPPTPNASATAKGKLKLANHLAGTADLPTVVDFALTSDADASGHTIDNVPDPTTALQATNKQYVDNAASGAGLQNKGASRLATTTALPTLVYANGTAGVGATLTGVSVGALSIDGTALSVADRVIIKNQVAQLQNGIYTVTAVGSAIAVFVLTRATNMDQNTEVGQAYSYVTAGSVNQNTSWNVNAGTYTVGTTAIVWNQFNAAPSLVGGDGITVVGNLIDADFDNSTIGLNGSNQLIVKTGGVTGTELEDIVSAATVGDATHIPIVSYDVNGRITSTTTATITSGTQRTFPFFAA